MKKLLLLCLIACGDTDPSPPPEDAPLARISLDAPTALDVGAPLAITWTVTDAEPDDRVRLQVFAPGGPLTRTAAGYHFAGSAPGTIYAGSLAADGTLSDQSTLHPISGAITVLAPTTAGDWRVVASLVRGEHPVDLTSTTTWVATTGVRIEVSRTWATSDQVVQVGVRTRQAEPLRLSAWLTAPDGTITTLPGTDPQYRPVAEGTIPSDLPPLLFQRLGAYGTGRYLVSARLETLDGIERGFAGAVIQVCDEPGAIAGTVTGGAGALVTALNLVDRETATVTAGADGSFTLPVSAGSWIVVGAGAGATTEVACGQTVNVAFDAVAPIRTSPRPALYADVPAVTTVRFVVTPVASGSAGVDADDTFLIAEVVATRIMDGRDGFSAATMANFAGILGLARMQQAIGTDARTAIDLSTLQILPDYAVTVRIATVGERIRTDLRLVHQATGSNISATSIDTPDLESILAELPDAVARLLGNPNDLRARVDQTDAPLLNAEWERATAAPGAMVTGRIHVGDTDTGKVFPNELVTFTVDGPGGTGGSAITDASGFASMSFTVPDDAATGSAYLLGGEITRRNGEKVKAAPTPLLVQGVTSAIRMLKPVLRTGGERTDIVITMPQAAGDEAGVMAAVVSAPVMARFDGAGVARFEVITEGVAGKSQVRVRTPAMLLGGEALEAVTFGYVVRALDMQLFVEPTHDVINDQVLQVRGTVAELGVAVPNLPIAIELEGAGEVERSSVTDAAGRISVFYRAPAQGSGTTTIKLVVVKDGDVVERQIPIRYAPPCTGCPIQITSSGFVSRGGQLLLVANQPVTWSATRGTITADGLFTAPNLGGTTRVTATSLADPDVSSTVAIIEECTFDEIIGPTEVTFQGTITPQGVWSPRVSATCLEVRLRIQNAGGGEAFVFDHHQACADGQGLMGFISFIQPQLAACSLGITEFGPCGQLGSLFLAPDPSTDGMTKRSYSSTMNHQPTGADPPGACIFDFAGSGILTRQ